METNYTFTSAKHLPFTFKLKTENFNISRKNQRVAFIFQLAVSVNAATAELKFHDRWWLIIEIFFFLPYLFDSSPIWCIS